MQNKSLKEKISDLSFWTVIFLILYLIVAFLLKSSWLKVSLPLPVIYDLLKDGLTITAGLLAPVAALLLFSDWKEQHVLTLVDTAARKISEDIQDLYTLTIQAFYKDPLECSDLNIRLHEHTTKGSLFDLRRSIEINEKIIINSGIECNTLLFNIMSLRQLSHDLEDNIRMGKHSKSIIDKKVESNGHLNDSTQDRYVFDQLKRCKLYYDEKINDMNILIKKLDKQLKEIQI